MSSDPTSAITIEVLPAFHGDCLLVSCHRAVGPPWRLLVDGGPPNHAPALRARLEALTAADRYLDLLICTHIDADHIGGLLPILDAPPHGLRVDEVWFNSDKQLPAPPEDRSVAQGMTFAKSLTAIHGEGPWAWNRSFAGGAVKTANDGGFVTLPRASDHDPAITLVSPTERRLAALSTLWAQERSRVERGEPSEEPTVIPPLQPLGDLVKLAATETTNDASVPNGSAIAVLVEHRGASVLLGADAFPNVLSNALVKLAASRGATNVPVDVFKLPHHGSRSNVTERLLRLAPARHYVVSTNGDIFGHPDDPAVARVVVAAPPSPTIWFNYRNERTARWGDATLQRHYRYTTRYPATDAGGIRIELPVNETA